MVIFKRYNNIGEALVAFSALESAEFHPSWHNYNHAHIAYMQMLAFGGLIILVPSSELVDAKLWIRQLQQNPKQDGDNLPTRKYGMWRHNFSIIGFNSPAIIFVPALWVRPWIYLLVLFTIVAVSALLFGINSLWLAVLLLIIAAAVVYVLGVLACFLPPLILLALWLVCLNVQIFTGGVTEQVFANAMLLFPIGILLHAKYIAVPQLEKRKSNEH